MKIIKINIFMILKDNQSLQNPFHLLNSRNQLCFPILTEVNNFSAYFLKVKVGGAYDVIIGY